jgi:hypothetical protein
LWYNVENHTKGSFKLEKLYSFITVICPVLAIIISIWYYRCVVKKKDISKERLLSIYDPLLKLLKNHLYTYKNNENFDFVIKQVCNVIENNRAYVGNDVYNGFEIFLNCEEKDKQMFYEKFCNSFLNTYNNLCKYVGIPKISMTYRYQHNWYDRHGKIVFITKAVSLAILQTILIFSLLFVLFITVGTILCLTGIIPMP